MPRAPTPKPTPLPPALAWRRWRRLFGLAPVAAPAASLSDYALQEVVARSARATVYRATERSSGRLVALKTVRLGGGGDRGLWRERFLREAQAAARLSHDCIVAVYGSGVQGEGDASTGWLAMEWAHGADLSRHAAGDRLLPEAVVVGIGQRVALALAEAHGVGIVHRDIKPANVLFDPATGLVKVTDFGSSRIVDSEATRSGVMLGTPAYMAPEQLAGSAATPQVDLYALGVLLFELLTGRRPFDADSMGDLLARIARETPPRVSTLRPGLPPLLDDIVARLLAKQPGQRQASAHQLALELRVAYTGCSGAAAPAGAAKDPLLDPPASSPFQGTIPS